MRADAARVLPQDCGDDSPPRGVAEPPASGLRLVGGPGPARGSPTRAVPGRPGGGSSLPRAGRVSTRHLCSRAAEGPGCTGPTGQDEDEAGRGGLRPHLRSLPAPVAPGPPAPTPTPQVTPLSPGPLRLFKAPQGWVPGGVRGRGAAHRPGLARGLRVWSLGRLRMSRHPRVGTTDAEPASRGQRGLGLSFTAPVCDPGPGLGEERGGWWWLLGHSHQVPRCLPDPCRAALEPEEAGRLAAERARAPIVPFGADLCQWGQEQPEAREVHR